MYNCYVSPVGLLNERRLSHYARHTATLEGGFDACAITAPVSLSMVEPYNQTSGFSLLAKRGEGRTHTHKYKKKRKEIIMYRDWSRSRERRRRPLLRTRYTKLGRRSHRVAPKRLAQWNYIAAYIYSRFLFFVLRFFKKQMNARMLSNVQPRENVSLAHISSLSIRDTVFFFLVGCLLLNDLHFMWVRSVHILFHILSFNQNVQATWRI